MVRHQDKIVRILVALFPKAKIYLFGSYARGTQTVASDIDIALDNYDRIPSLELAEAKNILEGITLAQRIDLVDLNAVPERLHDIILKEGVIWKS